MKPFALISIILTLAALISFLNHRTLKLPGMIAIMLGSQLVSLLFILFHHFGWNYLSIPLEDMLKQIDFKNLLLNGMLGFLLFAGALAVDLKEFKANKWKIATLASLTTIASTLAIGTLIYYLLPWLGLSVSYLYCLLFGALISPTDPIAVLNTFKKLNSPKSITACVEGESLFNDGVGIVLFLTLFGLTVNNHAPSWQSVSILFVQQALGGLAYGALLGIITHFFIKFTQDSKTAILITLMTVTGGYTLALNLNISGALAMVVTGLVVGKSMRNHLSQPHIQESLVVFWEVVDEILNAILFLLLGLELLLIHATTLELWCSIIVIPLILAVRWITVAIPMKLFHLKRAIPPFTIAILTWGGLRGGLAIALALSIPNGQYRELILVMTYAVVAFSILIQGTTINSLVKLANRDKKEPIILPEINT